MDLLTGLPPHRHSRESGNPVRHTIPAKAGIQNDKHNLEWKYLYDGFLLSQE